MDKLMIGDRIKAARKKLNLTQEALAERVDVTLYYMGEIERGVKTPSLDLFIRLVEVLDVSETVRKEEAKELFKYLS